MAGKKVKVKKGGLAKAFSLSRNPSAVRPIDFLRASEKRMRSAKRRGK